MGRRQKLTDPSQKASSDTGIVHVLGYSAFFDDYQGLEVLGAI
jgi:hypothetical protein